MKKIFILTGEPSGDKLAAEAIIKLKYNKKTEKRHRVKVILKNGEYLLSVILIQ